MTRIQSLSILALLWTIWCFLHSLLISRSVTVWLKKITGRKYGYYRLIYNSFSFLSLVPVVYFQAHLEQKIIFIWTWPWSLWQYAMYATAFYLFYSGFRVYDMQSMLGIKQIKQMKHGGRSAMKEFSATGILAHVRHPWYSGAILLVWAFGPVTDVTLVTKVVLTAYILVGTLLEERKLIDAIGEPYRVYRKNVPMLIPRIKRYDAG